MSHFQKHKANEIYKALFNKFTFKDILNIFAVSPSFEFTAHVYRYTHQCFIRNI